MALGSLDRPLNVKGNEHIEEDNLAISGLLDHPPVARGLALIRAASVFA